MQVSQLMRYQVENSSKEFVSIDDEIAFISSYIQLEKERVGYRCEINYNENFDEEKQYKIAPMLLISFIENAFKHGACTIENCFVNIDISIKENKLSLIVSNSIPTKKKAVVSTKIGLENTQKRLEIIYPEKYKLEIKPTETVFNVNLEIDLS